MEREPCMRSQWRRVTVEHWDGGEVTVRRTRNGWYTVRGYSDEMDAVPTRARRIIRIVNKMYANKIGTVSIYSNGWMWECWELEAS